MSADPTPILTALAAELGSAPNLTPGDLAALASAASDAPQLRRWLKRRLAGEPIAHITGRFLFRGREFLVDKRAYVTDPELTHLVDAVLTAARTFAATHGRAPLIAEIGVGCASLAITLKHALPDARVVGLDLDPDALAVAARNIERAGLAIRLIESDLFASWPADLPPPDLIYGDPPWGDANMLYDDERPAGHYQAMPPVSAFPLGGPTGVHKQILQEITGLGWLSEIWLNGGVIPRERLAALGALAPAHAVLSPAAGISLLWCGQS